MSEDYYSDASAKMAIGMQGTGGRLRAVSQTEQLEERKKVLEFELARVNAALEALRANPEIEKVLNLVRQAL